MSQPLWTPKSPARLRAVEPLRPSREVEAPDTDATDATAAAPSDPVREQVRTMEAMALLAGGMAHIFNNMLTAIGFETELAVAALPADDPGRKHLREIERIGDRGAALARQLLAFSGSQVLHPRLLQLNELVADLQEGLRQLAGDAIDLELQLTPDLPLVQVDREQIVQALLNLASNARDAMPGGGRLTIATSAVELGAVDLADPDRLAPGPYVRLQVSDTGAGLREEVRQRIFEPFFTTKEGAEPAGLGLSTVYGIVVQSGGQVRAESEPGAGTTFLLDLPPAGDRRTAGDARPTASWETLLLVEDEANVRKPLAEILRSRGYAVLEAGDAAEAIEACRRHPGPIHLMVTDVLLTGLMNGVDLADHLSYERPEMKVLFATGYPAGLADHPNRLHRAELLLAKPFSGRALTERVRDVLAARLTMAEPTSATPDDALHAALGRLSAAIAAARTPRSHQGIGLDALEAAAGEVAAAAAALQRRAAEREESSRSAAGEATSRLAGGVAHLLNDLLTGVACDAELALSRLPATDPIRKHVESVCRGAERGGILARDLLAVGREQVLRPRVVRLNELIGDLEGALAQAAGPGVQLVLDLAPQLPPVEVDPGGMEQQLLALALRAREAMGAEGGRLGIWTTVSAPTGRNRERQVLLALTDSGEEIAAADIALLCEAPRLAGLGTGKGTLGLAAACSFVRQSGGTVEIHSRQGEGTVVRILLPAAAKRAAVASARPAVELGGTILLVEDDDNVRNPLAELLEDRGYLVLAAAGGGAATALAARHEGPIHLLVSDVMMPGMTGIEFARALAPLRPEMRVLFTTGHPEAVAAAGRAAAGGPAFVLAKPFTSQLLLRRIDEVLRGAEPAGARMGGD